MNYDYHCEKCGHDFVIAQSVREYERKKEVHCPKCQSTDVKRRFGIFFAKTAVKS